jgi:hypothetical protein
MAIPAHSWDTLQATSWLSLTDQGYSWTIPWLSLADWDDPITSWDSFRSFPGTLWARPGLNQDDLITFPDWAGIIPLPSWDGFGTTWALVVTSWEDQINLR